MIMIMHELCSNPGGYAVQIYSGMMQMVECSTRTFIHMQNSEVDK